MKTKKQFENVCTLLTDMVNNNNMMFKGTEDKLDYDLTIKVGESDLTIFPTFAGDFYSPFKYMMFLESLRVPCYLSTCKNECNVDVPCIKAFDVLSD